MIRRLKAIGFWRNREWPLAFPHPAELLYSQWDAEERKKVVAYLESGLEIFPQLGFSYCRFPDGPAEEEMGDSEQTDGTWVWPSALPMYVARFGVMLPEAFRVEVGAKGHVCENVAVDESTDDIQYSFDEWIEWSTAYRANRVLGVLSRIKRRWFPSSAIQRMSPFASGCRPGNDQVDS